MGKEERWIKRFEIRIKRYEIGVEKEELWKMRGELWIKKDERRKMRGELWIKNYKIMKLINGSRKWVLWKIVRFEFSLENSAIFQQTNFLLS